MLVDLLLVLGLRVVLVPVGCVLVCWGGWVRKRGGGTYQGLAQPWEGASPGRSRAMMVISCLEGSVSVRMAAVERPTILEEGGGGMLVGLVGLDGWVDDELTRRRRW